MAEELAEHKNLVITGDFNLHVNDPEDQDGEVFCRHDARIGT